jgi:hypothetical protein
MQPKVGDKIIAPNGFEWFVRNGETFQLLGDMKKIRGTNEWQQIKPGDYVVTRGGMIRQVMEVSTALNRIHYTIGTWDELKTVDYIAPNQFDLAEGDIVYYITFNRLGIVKRGIVYSNGKDHGLNTMWKRATPEIVVAIRDGVEHKAYYHRGTFFDMETFAAIPNFGVTEKPNPYVGKWYVKQSPHFPDVAVLCTEFTNGNYVLKQPNDDLTAFVCPPSMAKLEELRVGGHLLIGKSATFSKATGKQVWVNDDNTRHCGKWYLMGVSENKVPGGVLMPMFCYDYKNGMLHFRSADNHKIIWMEPKQFKGHEELKIVGKTLVGKTDTFDLATGQRLKVVDKFSTNAPQEPLGASGIQKGMEVFKSFAVNNAKMLEAAMKRCYVPTKMWLPSDEHLPPTKRWLLNTHFHNPKKIVPISGCPHTSTKSNLFVLDNGRDLQFQHIYQKAFGSLTQAYCNWRKAKGITEEQTKGMQFLPVKIVKIGTVKALKWLLEETELTVYTGVIGGGSAKPCRMEFLEIDGRVSYKYVAVWQDRRFEIFPVDTVLNRVYYFEVET